MFGVGSGIALSHFKLYKRRAIEAEQRLSNENACLAEIGRVITSSLNIDEVYERFAGQVSALIPFDRLAVTLLDEEQEYIHWSYFEGTKVPGIRRGIKHPLKGTLTESVIKSGSSVLFQTEEEDELLRMFPFNLPFFKAGFRSFMAAPLISRDRIIGTLHLRSTTINAYANKDVALAERVADQISGAIANAQLLAKSRETEEALRKSELRFATILDIAEDAIISMDENQTITLFNQGAEKIFGYLADEMIGKSLDFLLPQWAIETHRAHIQMFEAGPEAARTMNDRGEVFGQRKDGVMFPAEASISKLEFDGKKVFTVILRDITARKEAEAVLHESDERFRQVADNIREVFWLFDLSLGRVIYASPAYSEIFGLSPETLYEDPSSWQRIMHHEDVERQQAIFDNPPTEPWHGEFRIWHPDGSLHWISNRASPIFDEAGKVKRLVGIAEDITERKLAEEAVRESQSRFIQLAENIPDAIWLADPKAGLLYMSPAYENIYGLTLESLSEDPTSWLDAVHPDDRERVRDIRENQEKEDRYYEFRVVHSDGSIRWVSNQRTPIVDENGDVYRIVGVAQDITHRKLMEEQLLQAQKMEVVGQLAGGIAHDFNNLLTAILAYSHLGMMKLSPEDPVAGYMEEIKKAGERAARLTSQLLTFSRRQISEPRVLNLNEIIIDTNKMLRRLIGENIELVALPTEDLWLTEVDPGQMEQVLVNLAVNARDAMPGGGKLIIKTAKVRVDEDLARLHPDLSEGEYVTLSVQDTGTGIAKEVIEHIFEPFFTTKEIGKGTGLGLAMCFGIVTQSGGCIVVDSEPGKGTTFTIYLPRVDVPATNLPLRDESGYLPTGSETVLLVEDEPALLNVAAHVLREQGYTVLEATNGTDALRVSEDCADQEIHLLLTDVVMPLMGGKELADKLRLIRPGISVLFASGYTDDAIVSQDILEERTKFMQKPFTPSDLARKVKDTIHAR